MVRPTIFFVTAILSIVVRARLNHDGSGAIADRSCAKADEQNRLRLQTEIMGACEDMCKSVGAYPQCKACPHFEGKGDMTPGVMTWDELFEHMGNLRQWGRDQIGGMYKAAGNLPPPAGQL
eukprot:gnl/MRDRNA2_/MRDRNA2_93062_c0_seq1.p1 gnl/MRDRNA2_/MRDRNA2_93062_c0~~gnl/MRDRNA2_/MRDRNA2_93062_c0_seq1.p1  ORF type:complete len:121 (+),score=20.75 gnl/MRDRNA2_/MRDRNA2_93062_c0_seq1:131-493(+)